MLLQFFQMEPVKRDIKRKVIWRHAFRVLLEIIVLVILAGANVRVFYLAVLVSITWSLFSFYRSKEKYLVSLNLQNSSVILTYLTKTLKQDTDSFNAETVLLAEIVRNGFVFKYPLTLNIKRNEGWTFYKILDKQTANSVRQYLDVANSGLPKQSAVKASS